MSDTTLCICFCRVFFIIMYSQHSDEKTFKCHQIVTSLCYNFMLACNQITPTISYPAMEILKAPLVDVFVT